MALQAEKVGVVKSLSETIQQKLIIPAEQRFSETERRIGQLERRLSLLGAGLAFTSGLALVLAFCALLK